MSIPAKITSLTQISRFLQSYLKDERQSFPALSDNLDEVLRMSSLENPWFTPEFLRFTLEYWQSNLGENAILEWTKPYSLNASQKKVGLILAGNIPMVGFHDVLSVLISGHHAQIKLSSKDRFLIPFFLDFWKSIDDSISFEFVEQLYDFDAVIATGSNNTARYFTQYFGDKPHIIRKNRSSVAILDGHETEAELQGLAEDVFMYFGLGCRNVTQVWVPENYDLQNLFQAFFNYKDLASHHKYYSSYEYYRALYMLNKDVFWDNNFILIKDSQELFAPVATLQCAHYSTFSEVDTWMEKEAENLQVVVSHIPQISNAIAFGTAQRPPLNSYADGVDVMAFLETI